MQNSKFYDNFEELENETYISNLFLDLVIKGNVKELYGVNYISNILNKIDNQENLEGKEFRNVGEFLESSEKIYMYSTFPEFGSVFFCPNNTFFCFPTPSFISFSTASSSHTEPYNTSL